MPDSPSEDFPTRTDKLHPDEVDIDVALVRRLVAAQFPDIGDMTIRPVRSTGTVNAIYRLGDHLYARMPRTANWEASLEKEWDWLPRLAPHLTLQIPTPVAKGNPAPGYPFSWAVYEWMDGEPYADELVDDEGQAARDLARFVGELRGVEPVAGAPRAGREPLLELDGDTREAIESARGVIDSHAATRAWEHALEAQPWQGTPVWIHTDLLRPNILVGGGRLRAVIDFGGAGIGDPAADVIAAWSVFGPLGRRVFRRALEVDDATYNRARGFALHHAAMIIPYYRETNPDFVTLARRTVEQILADATSDTG
jgi:aminoglycoside phosphotransferase (APT) family kinase protein